MRLPALLLMMTALAGPAEAPRYVLTLEAKAGRAAVTVENATHETVSLSAKTWLTLSAGRPEDLEPPRYWAKVEVQNLPTPTRPLVLGAVAKQRVALEPDSQLWSGDRFGGDGWQPMHKIVVPGAYRLGVQIRNNDGSAWLSNEVPVTVGIDGSLNF